MKKLLLSTIALSISMAGFSQLYWGDNSAAGTVTSGAFDDFSTVDPVATEVACENEVGTANSAYAGIYWWEGSTATASGGSGGCTIALDGEDCSTSFVSSKQTRAVGGEVYNITQPYGSFEPIGVSFGTYDNGAGGSLPFALDLTGDANMSITFQASGGDPLEPDASEEVKVTFQLQDVNTATTGRALSLMSTFTGNAGGEFWRNDIGFAHDNGNGTVSVNADHTFTFDWATAKTSVLNANGTTTYEGGPATGGLFELDKVIAVTITVTNGTRRNSGDNSYDPYSWKGTFTIKDFQIGSNAGYDYSAICWPTATEEELASLITIAPNPTNSEAVVDLGALSGDIQVVDAQSNDITAEVLRGNTVNLNGKASGIYFVIVNTAEGRAVKRISKQ